MTLSIVSAVLWFGFLLAVLPPLLHPPDLYGLVGAAALIAAELTFRGHRGVLRPALRDYVALDDTPALMDPVNK